MKTTNIVYTALRRDNGTFGVWNQFTSRWQCNTRTRLPLEYGTRDAAQAVCDTWNEVSK